MMTNLPSWFLLRAVRSRQHLGEKIRAGTVHEQRPPVICLDDDFPCDLCAACFPTRQRLATHCARAHGALSMASVAVRGSCCQVCGVEHWSTYRLREHLRRSEGCLAVYVGADLEAEGPCGSARAQHAWRPAAKVSGPPPWWATLRPELQ